MLPPIRGRTQEKHTHTNTHTQRLSIHAVLPGPFPGGHGGTPDLRHNHLRGHTSKSGLVWSAGDRKVTDSLSPLDGRFYVVVVVVFLLGTLS